MTYIHIFEHERLSVLKNNKLKAAQENHPRDRMKIVPVVNQATTAKFNINIFNILPFTHIYEI